MSELPAPPFPILTEEGRKLWERFSAAAATAQGGALDYGYAIVLQRHCDDLELHAHLVEELKRARTKQHRRVLKDQLAQIDPVLEESEREVLLMLRAVSGSGEIQ